MPRLTSFGVVAAPVAAPTPAPIAAPAPTPTGPPTAPITAPVAAPAPAPPAVRSVVFVPHPARASPIAAAPTNFHLIRALLLNCTIALMGNVQSRSGFD